MDIVIEVLVGLIVGGLGVWLLLRGRTATLLAEFKAAAEANAKLNADLSAAGARLERLEQLEADILAKEKAVDGFRSELESLRVKSAEMEGQLNTERRSYEERKLELERTLNQAEETMKATFDSLAAKALDASSQNFLKLAKSTLETEQEKAKSELTQRKQSIDELVKPLAESLKSYEDHLRKLEESHQERDVATNERIQQLLSGINQQQSATNELKGLLRGPSSRGRAGEMLLERIFEAAGLSKGLTYFVQQHEGGEEGGGRPDFIVKMPGDKEIVIDSKFVLAAYEAAMQCDDDKARADKLKEHARDVRGHIESLSRRPYVGRSKNVELVVMFLPLDACLTAAQEVDPDIVSKGWDRRIVLATPSLLFAVMRMVALDWRQENLRANSDEIQKLGKEMVDRIRIAVEHFAGIGDGLDKATRAYNSAVGSIQSQLLTTANRFQKLEAGKEVRFEQKKLPKLVDREPALFTKPELQSLPSPEVLELLEGSADSEVTVQELLEANGSEVVESLED
jgi:DNA recombination protein RmuC